MRAAERLQPSHVGSTYSPLSPIQQPEEDKRQATSTLAISEESSQSSIEDYYQGRHVFCTGGSGMLGTAYLSRLVLDTPVARVYALVRGGENRLWKTWGKLLPSKMVQALQSSGKLVIWDGDITLPNCGLTGDQVALISEKVSIFVHSASTINLQKSLAEVAPQIIYPSLALAKMAVGCVNLARFVYVSTAYANAFLRKTPDGGIEGHNAVIDEDIHHIRSRSSTSAKMELFDLEAYDTTPEYKFVRHPFPYSYAKHLTERLLLEFFEEAQLGQALLIIRPSCIGPADSKPYPFYEVPGSSPVTRFLTSLIASPPMTLNLSSHLRDPSTAKVDETPVDMVVNRLVAHVALESSGCVHAVAGSKGLVSSEELFNAAIQLRRLRWPSPRIKWNDIYWKSDRLWGTARLMVLSGCAFTFAQTKTDLVWKKMTNAERSKWPLYPCENNSIYERVAGREKALTYMLGQKMEKTFGLPANVAWLFYKPRNIERAML